jgi:hypothetical protein
MPAPRPDEMSAFALASVLKSDMLNNPRVRSSFCSAIEDGVTKRHAEFYVGIADADDYLVTVTRLGSIRPRERGELT